MAYMLGAIIVKGGKVLSHGHNHRRTHYDGSPGNETHQTAMSMHAEMHAIYSATGFSPAFKTQRTALVAAHEKLQQRKKNNCKLCNDYNGKHPQHHYHHVHYHHHAYDEYRYQQQIQQYGVQHEQQQQQHYLRQQQQRQREQGTFVLLRSLAVRSRGLKTLKPASNGSNAWHERERSIGAQEEKRKRKRGAAVAVQQRECCESAPRPSWDTRRRDPRINGADIYVARVTRTGIIGPASPCWRCIEWCRWAGIKRIFHWDPEGGRWEAVKVNDVERVYCTNSDLKMVGGDMW
ncbi:hypothetical protein CALCODRAFT_484798 [Calocera cornea HHB12733]|uniref:Uncharacterized protein n=1 Tax=Calocera cornea HHB12733 TaxID=1353952 RepID=A0A165ES77_9BASI|nr:hypothetical protein CALCODRAFT_484798 [Calocera cornea HHB12733]